MTALMRFSLAVLLTTAFNIHAQTWPTKPVRIIASVGPGQAADIVARSLAARLTASIGQTFIVENVPGAAGSLGAQAVARANPDGYTLLFTGGGALVTNLFMFKSLPYDPVKDLTPVAAVTRGGGFYISVPADSPFKALGDIVGFARASPGKLSYGVDTSNIYTILLGRLINKTATLDMVEIPYKSEAVALQDVIAGRVQLLITAGSSIDSAVRSGKLRRVAVSSENRNPFFTDLPTVGETLPGMKMEGAGLSLVAPSGVSAELAQRMNRAVAVVMKQPEFLKELASRGQLAGGDATPQQISDELAEQRRIWAKLFPELGIAPQ
jgi:tripartite-type tricarboxylate transporter receptor subunit TctC